MREKRCLSLCMKCVCMCNNRTQAQRDEEVAKSLFQQTSVGTSDKMRSLITQNEILTATKTMLVGMPLSLSLYFFLSYYFSSFILFLFLPFSSSPLAPFSSSQISSQIAPLQFVASFRDYSHVVSGQLQSMAPRIDHYIKAKAHTRRGEREISKIE